MCASTIIQILTKKNYAKKINELSFQSILTQRQFLLLSNVRSDESIANCQKIKLQFFLGILILHHSHIPKKCFKKKVYVCYVILSA